MTPLRFAVRALWKARETTLIAIAILAIAIGTNTAVFSIVDAALLRPLPYRDAASIYVISAFNSKRAIASGAFSYPAFQDVAARARSLAVVAAVAPESFNATGGDTPEQLSGGRVSASFFDVLGMTPAIGRTFAPDDDRAGATDVVVIGRSYWARRFAAAPDAVGATLTLNGRSCTIVGALGVDLPPPFDGVDVWAPRVDSVSRFPSALINSGIGYLTAVGRLAPSTPLDAAQRELDAIEHDYARRNPSNTDADPDASLRLEPIRSLTAGTTRTPLLILMGAVGLVLLIACANVSNLLLARANARAHEAAVRLALGATRWDLVRWLGSESLLVALAGGATGVAIAFWTVDLARGTLQDLPRGTEIAVDGRVLAFSLAVSIAAGVILGLLPAAFAARQAPVDALKSGNRTTTGGRRSLRDALVVAEVALSFLLLIGAGLLLQSFTRLTRVQPGFDARGLLTFSASLPSGTYPNPESMRQFMLRATRGLQTTPGVAGASASMALPPAITTMAPYVTGDQPLLPIGERPVGEWAAVTPDYFATLRIPLKAGRVFTGHDTERTPLVVVISERLARLAWPNASPLGRRLLVGRFPGFAEVVGVVGDVSNNGIQRAPMPAMYTPYPQRPWPSMQFAVRAAGGDPLALLPGVRAAMRQADADLPLTRVEAMGATLAASISTERLLTFVLLAFAGIALVLAMTGLYGVISYSVSQRTREIGTRIALGADPSAIMQLVIGSAFRLALAGIVAGGIATAAASRVLRGVLFEVSLADPATYVSVLLLFALTAGVAAAVPARRALRIDPQSALRAD
jgi:predicted permease